MGYDAMLLAISLQCHFWANPRTNVTHKLLQEWQQRRVVLTKNSLFFALVDEDLIRDQIPLHEIEDVEIMHEPTDLEDLLSRFREGRVRRQLDSRRASSASKKSERDVDLQVTKLKVFQIRTIEDGFNTGRTYYVQTESSKECSIFVQHLKAAAASAVRRAKGSTKFQELQNKARRIYECAPFQILAALLIIAVSHEFPFLISNFFLITKRTPSPRRTSRSASPRRN